MTRRSTNGGGSHMGRMVSGALLIATVAAASPAQASSPAEGYKSTVIEALNAAADQQAPEKVKPMAPAAPAPAAVTQRPAAAAAVQVAAPVGAEPAGPVPRLSETLPLKPSRGEVGDLEVGRDSGSGLSYMGLAFAMLLLGGAAIGAYYLQKRGRLKGDGSRTATLEVVSTIRVAGRYQVALIRVPGSMLVVGVTDKGLTLLTELPEDAMAPPLPEAPRYDAAAKVVGQPVGPPPATRPAPQTAPPGRTQPSQAVARTQTVPTSTKAESSELFDQLLRLSDARAAAPAEPEVVEGEQADIRRRLQRYQQHGGGIE